LKETIFIITFGILIYLGCATILGDSGLIGSYGAIFAKYNKLYFGYISYVYILALLIPLYFFYKNTKINFRKIELSMATFLLFFAFLLAQAMLISNAMRGKIGLDFVDSLAPYIGVFGLWIFWLIISLVSVVMISNKTTDEMLAMFSEFLKSNKVKIQKSIPDAKKEKNSTIQQSKKEQITKDRDEKVEDVRQEVQTLEEPTYLRRKEDDKKLQEKDNDTSMLVKNETLKDEIQMIASEENIKEETQENSHPKEEKVHNILEMASTIKEQKNAVIVEELEENKKLLDTIEKGKVEKPKNFILPSVDFLQKPDSKTYTVDESELDDKIKYLIDKLAHFKIDGDVIRTYAGPVVSTFEFKPAANVKVSKILNLQDDLAMALSAETIRIQAPIPGKDVVGIEIPNAKVETIYLKDLLDSKLFKDSSSPLTIALGKDIVGKPFVTDLKKLPHLLIAGTTGSGKSVGINSMILSLLYKNSPDQLRLLMIDPKMLEFSIYNEIPHLLTPVITKPKQAIVALNNMVSEMERRYELMSQTKTKNIENYNEKIKTGGGEHFPYIVVIIDELADLMMTSGIRHTSCSRNTKTVC